MRNRYAGKCLRCGKPVGIGEGFFQKGEVLGWLVRCKNCVGKGNKPIKVSQRNPPNTA
jgi:DNA-directed RNA polymerase subunit RPC12/RpoP